MKLYIYGDRGKLQIETILNILFLWIRINIIKTKVKPWKLCPWTEKRKTLRYDKENNPNNYQKNTSI